MAGANSTGTTSSQGGLTGPPSEIAGFHQPAHVVKIARNAAPIAIGTTIPFTMFSVVSPTASWSTPLTFHIAVTCNGVAVTGLSPAIQLLAGDQTAGIESSTDYVHTASASNGDTTGIMRANGGGHIYNLRVPSTEAAGARFTIRVRCRRHDFRASLLGPTRHSRLG